MRLPFRHPSICSRRDLNPHDFSRRVLNALCLPVPPPEQLMDSDGFEPSSVAVPSRFHHNSQTFLSPNKHGMKDSNLHDMIWKHTCCHYINTILCFRWDSNPYAPTSRIGDFTICPQKQIEPEGFEPTSSACNAGMLPLHQSSSTNRNMA